MRIHIVQKLEEPLELPIGYHHILQAVIYNAIRELPEYEELHNQGYANNNRTFRMFTFSEIWGKYCIKGKKIYFFNKIEFWVSSPDEQLIEGIAEVFSFNGISWGNTYSNNIEVETVEEPELYDQIQIKMMSPICVYSTDVATKKIKFYQPGEKKFEQLIYDNFKRKYEAFYGVEPIDVISIKPVLVLPKDKKVTTYKQFFYDGWTGKYCLAGRNEYLKFLYDTGIGSKNSMGFGMFDVI